MWNAQQATLNLVGIGLVVMVGISPPAWGTTLTVPTEAATIQAAVNAGVDSVFVLPGAYPESVTVRVAILIAGKSEGSDDRPILHGLAIRPLPGLGGEGFRFQRLAVSGRVLIVNNDEHADLTFTDCVLGAGIIDQSSFSSSASIRIRRCALQGSSFLLVDGANVEVDTCQVRGGIRTEGNTPTVIVRGCTFDGPGNDVAITTGDETVSCFIQGNVVRGFRLGMALYAGEMYLFDNRIEDSSGEGLRASGASIFRATGNVFRRCHSVIINGDRDVWIAQNRVEDSAGPGMLVSGDQVDLRENVVLRSGGDGIWIGSANFYELMVVRNTVCGNGGSGIVWWGPYNPHGVTRVEGNVGYANGRYGLSWLPGVPVALRCNDWFGNVLGAVENVPPSVADFSVDPMFCGADSGDYRLRADSPLVDWPGCGLVGALAVGCGTTGTLIQRFTAERVAEGVRVRWEVAEGTAAEISLERSEVDSPGSWTRPVTERSTDGRFVEELDRSAAAERAYWYRLVAVEGGSVSPLVEPLRVGAVAGERFALEDVVPRLGGGPVRIRFSLAHAAAIAIEIFDVQGRSVTSVARGQWPPGGHEVEWTGVTRTGNPAPAGWYLVRYRYPGGEESRRFVRTF